MKNGSQITVQIEAFFQYEKIGLSVYRFRENEKFCFTLPIFPVLPVPHVYYSRGGWMWWDSLTFDKDVPPVRAGFFPEIP